MTRPICVGVARLQRSEGLDGIFSETDTEVLRKYPKCVVHLRRQREEKRLGLAFGGRLRVYRRGQTLKPSNGRETSAA